MMGAPALVTPAGWWAWLVDRARDYLELVPRIYNLAHEAAVIAGDAARAGDERTAELARAAVPRIMALWRQADSISGPIRRIAAAGPGMGAPWALAGLSAATVVAVGAAAAWVFARYGAEAQIVAQLAEGALTAAEAADLLASAGRAPSMLSTVGSVGLLVGLAAVAWLGSRRR